jgi:hypothetical protein
MLALDIMLLVLTQSSGSTVAPEATHAPRPDVEVIGPAQTNRMICRVISTSNSRIPSRRICQTQAQIAEARDRMQAEAGTDLASTMRRTNETLENSGYGNWARSRTEAPVGITDARPVQVCRIRMGAAGC